MTETRTEPTQPRAAPATVPPRVAALPAAVELLRKLRAQHGPLMVHQSGGCCDGSSPMCYPQEDFIVGDRDVLLGILDLRLGLDEVPTEQAPDDAGVPVWISGPQFEAWKHTQLVIDVVPGRGAGFSLEGPEGVRFLTRSRVFTDEEAAALNAAPLITGADYETGARPLLPTSPQVVASVDDACPVPGRR